MKEDVPQPIWQELKDHGYVADALNPYYACSRQEVLDQVKKRLRQVREMLSWLDLQDLTNGKGGGSGGGDDENNDEDKKKVVPLPPDAIPDFSS